MATGTDKGETLTTNELLARIEREFGVAYDRTTVTFWTRLADDPLPVAYKGKPGQAHRYAWPTFVEWFERYRAKEAERGASSGRAASGSGNAEIGADDYLKARARGEHYRAVKAELEAKQLAGELVPRDEVEREAFAQARAAQVALTSIPDRLAAELAAELDPVEVHRRLEAEIVAVCNAIADGVANVAGDLAEVVE